MVGQVPVDPVLPREPHGLVVPPGLGEQPDRVVDAVHSLVLRREVVRRGRVAVARQLLRALVVAREAPHANLGGQTCPVSTERGTRRVQLVRRDGRDVSTLYGREGGGGGGGGLAHPAPKQKKKTG